MKFDEEMDDICYQERYHKISTYDKLFKLTILTSNIIYDLFSPQKFFDVVFTNFKSNYQINQSYVFLQADTTKPEELMSFIEKGAKPSHNSQVNSNKLQEFNFIFIFIDFKLSRLFYARRHSMPIRALIKIIIRLFRPRAAT